MKYILGLIFLATTAAHAAPTLTCKKVSANGLGVVRVDFVNPTSSLGDFKDFVVTFDSGGTDRYTTDAYSTVDSSTSESTEHAVFSNVSRPGLASLSYVFFSRPQDESSTGRSLKNGARMRLILPPATEIIKLVCDKSL